MAVAGLVVGAFIAYGFCRAVGIRLPYSVSDPSFLVATLLIAPVFEEWFFRGVLFGWLERRGLSRRFVIGASALGFGAFHLIGLGTDPARAGFYGLVAAYMVPIGVLLGIVRQNAGTWWASALAHAGYNGLFVALMWVFGA